MQETNLLIISHRRFLAICFVEDFLIVLLNTSKPSVERIFGAIDVSDDLEVFFFVPQGAASLWFGFCLEFRIVG